MEFAELKTKNPAELKDQLAGERANLFRFKQQARNNVLKQHNVIAETRKTIARIMLLLSSSR